MTIGSTGAAPIGVPNPVIEQFSIPPFLLPIYQACGTQYGIPWEVLASINRIETAFGTNLNVSTAGALGWMQFMPATWDMYGVDANNDGRKDPFNPVDAICAAARYLKAAGGEEDLYQAIFAYNHADWYVDEVLLYAKQYGNLPERSRRLADRPHRGRALPGRRQVPVRRRHLRAAGGEARDPDEGLLRQRRRRDQRLADPTRHRHLLQGRAPRWSPPTTGSSPRSARTSSSASSSSSATPTATSTPTRASARSPTRSRCRSRTNLSSKDFDLVTPGEGDAKPKISASRTTTLARPSTTRPRPTPARRTGQSGGAARRARSRAAADRSPVRLGDSAASGPTNTEDSRERLFALPKRSGNGGNQGLGGEVDDLLGKGMPGYETFKSYLSGVLRFDSKTMDTAPLRKGSHVVGGTIIGEIGQTDPAVAPHLHFEITPAGRGAHTIDPKPILDGWKLLEATAIYRAAGKNPFDDQATVGQVLLASKSQLQRQVLADPAPRDLLLRPRGHRHRPDRPPRPGDARVPGRPRLPAHDHLAEVRPQHHDHVRQRQRPLDRRRGRHRDGQRHPDLRQPGPGLDHRGRDQRPAEAAGARWSRPRSSR